MRIREYSDADWPEICRVHDAARIVELRSGGVDARAFRPMRDVAEEDEFFVSKTLVAVEGDSDERQAVLGFVSWNVDYITWLYVDPARHREGIGRKLVEEAFPTIGTGAWTHVLGGNDASKGLFCAAGMEVVFERPSECDGYPCTFMRLALPTSRMRDAAAKRV